MPLGPRSNEAASLRSARMLRELTGDGPPRSNEAASKLRSASTWLGQLETICYDEPEAADLAVVPRHGAPAVVP